MFLIGKVIKIKSRDIHPGFKLGKHLKKRIDAIIRIFVVIIDLNDTGQFFDNLLKRFIKGEVKATIRLILSSTGMTPETNTAAPPSSLILYNTPWDSNRIFPCGIHNHIDPG